MHMLTLILVEEILLPRYINCFTNFWCLTFNEEMTPPWLKHKNSIFICPVGCGVGVAEYADCISAERLDPSNDCPGYYTKQSDSEASVMQEIWGILSTLLLPLLPGQLWPGVVAPDRFISMDQIELFDI